MMNFPFGTNGKFIILGVPVLKHIRVCLSLENQMCTGNDTYYCQIDNVSKEVT